MNKRNLCSLLVSLLCALTFAQNADGVFGESAVSDYEKAVEFNLSKNWLEAYRKILSAEKMYDVRLKELNLQSQALDEVSFFQYFALKRTKAEIAYALGISSDMETVSQELWGMLNRPDIDDRNTLQAYVYKIDAGKFWLSQKYDSAETALTRVLEGSKDWLEYEFDFFYSVHGDFAQLYYKQEQYEKALAQLDTVLMHDKFKTEGSRISDIDNVGEKKLEIQSQRALCLARLGRYQEALKTIGPVCAGFRKSKDSRAYAEALRKKAKILMLQYDATGQYNADAVLCYQQYLSISRDYIDRHFVNMSESEREQYWMAEQPFVTDCFRLEDKAPGLLYDVALYSKAVLLQMGRDFKEGMTTADKKKALASVRVTWQQVRDKLPESGCAIEFIVYEKSGQDHIGALVLNKKASAPVFIDIASLKDFKSLKTENGRTVGEAVASTKHEDKDALYQCRQLSNLIWNGQLVKAMGQSKKIYFAPDGIFHQLAVEYLYPDSLNKKSMYRLTSTRLLVEGRQKIHADNMLMCGGVDYSVGQAASSTPNNDEQAYTIMSAKGMALYYLNGSKAEIDSIEALRHNESDKILRADSATESILRNLMGKYHLVLISTHGYFAEAATLGTDIRPASTDTQLSQSCLFLAGAEANMRNRKFDLSMPDGILSARELAAMDLSDVDLVSLSACQSGLGFVTVDGIFGLQRGLKTAGVKAVIASLWEVDDQATITLMTNLYRNLQNGISLQEAFSAARNTLEKTVVQKTYPRKGVADLIVTKQYNLPRYYNAFILIDGIEQ